MYNKSGEKGDILEYNGAGTSRGFSVLEITPIYGRRSVCLADKLKEWQPCVELWKI